MLLVLLLSVVDRSILHHYEFIPIEAVEASGVLFNVAVSGESGSYAIRYKNDLGMEWEHHISCALAGTGAGAIPFGFSLNGKTGLDGLVASGTMSSLEYYSPDFFTWSLVGSMSASAVGAGAGLSAGVIGFADTAQSTSFDTSGLESRMGTSVIGEASVDFMTGTCAEWEGADFSLAPEEELPHSPEVAPGEWTRVARLTIPFDTGESAPPILAMGRQG
ncbi:MAG: hypothetical protein GWP91_23990 [Rhodobacterales bacterium]|nr:hypothetical protein [Rhodobacterales bacterium]